MKTKWLLNFPPSLTEQPVTYTLIKEYDLRINILRASINLNVTGSLLILVEGTSSNINSAMVYLKSAGIHVISGDTQITWNMTLCVHCGVCTAICPAEALCLDPNTSILTFNTEKCLACGHCIIACPVGAMTDHLG